MDFITRLFGDRFSTIVKEVRELIDGAPMPTVNPECFACSIQPCAHDIAEGQADMARVHVHFRLPEDTKIGLAMGIIWLHAYKAGVHKGAEVMMRHLDSEERRANAN
jgi:hypothetical protein